LVIQNFCYIISIIISVKSTEDFHNNNNLAPVSHDLSPRVEGQEPMKLHPVSLVFLLHMGSRLARERSFKCWPIIKSKLKLCTDFLCSIHANNGDNKHYDMFDQLP